MVSLYRTAFTSLLLLSSPSQRVLSSPPDDLLAGFTQLSSLYRPLAFLPLQSNFTCYSGSPSSPRCCSEEGFHIIRNLFSSPVQATGRDVSFDGGAAGLGRNSSIALSLPLDPLTLPQLTIGLWVRPLSDPSGSPGSEG